MKSFFFFLFHEPKEYKAYHFPVFKSEPLEVALLLSITVGILEPRMQMR